MRDIAMLLAMFALVPLAFANSFNAYLLWGWTALLSANFYLYGFMQGVRYNFLFAGIALALWMLGKVDFKGKLSSNPTTILFAAFTVQVTLSAIFGTADNIWNWQVYEGFIKAIVFVMMMPIFVTTKLRLHAFVLIVCLALGFHGVVEGLKMLATAGGHKVHGIPTSMMSDNNHFAVGMAMLLPILVYLMQHLQNRTARLAAMTGLGLTVLSIVGTNSRGGFLCLAVVGMWYAITARRKVLSISLAFLLAVLAVYLAPDSWFDRIETISSAQDDFSFMGRVTAWKVSAAIALSNPFFGGGLHAIQSLPVWQEFTQRIDFLSFIITPPPEPFARAAHSIYFEVLGDLGFVGFILFIGLIVNAFLTARHIRRLVIGQSELLWARDLSDGLRLALVAYCVGGAAVSLAYLELFYVVLMLLEVLRQHVLATLGERTENLIVASGSIGKAMRGKA